MNFTSWWRDFPLLYELYRDSDQSDANNWFRQPNVIKALTSRHRLALDLEASLEDLDPVAWMHLKSKARNYVHKVDKWGYHRQLFECLHEVYGYGYLKHEGHREIEFIEEKRDTLTPDLRARKNDSLVLMEIKTVNESDWQKNYLEIPAEARDMVRARKGLSDAFKDKLLDSICKARQQLIAHADTAVRRRIVYLVIRPDFNFHGEEALNSFLRAQQDAEVEIVMRLLN